MLLCLRPFGEEACRFDNDVGTDTGPIDFHRILDLENLEAAALDGDGIFGVRDLMREISKNGIVFQKMREGLCIGNVIDGDELNVLVVDGGAHNIAANTAEAVDTNLNGHASSGGVT